MSRPTLFIPLGFACTILGIFSRDWIAKLPFLFPTGVDSGIQLVLILLGCACFIKAMLL